MAERMTGNRAEHQEGRLAIVTGASGGLGLAVATELAARGAAVVLAVRSCARGAVAAAAITHAVPDARVEVARLDIADLTSARRFAEDLRARQERIGLLVNNAGVMAPPKRRAAGPFELQFVTNYLGHFALTGLVFDLLAENARVVSVTSTAHWIGRISFDDLQAVGRYRRWRSYAQSKLANLMFALELDRRLQAMGSTIRSTAAHPGYAATNLESAVSTGAERVAFAVGNRLVAQTAQQGAASNLFAATADVPGGTFVGPEGLLAMRGQPGPARAANRARDCDVAERLWLVSERLSGVSYARPSAPSRS